MSEGSRIVEELASKITPAEFEAYHILILELEGYNVNRIDESSDVREKYYHCMHRGNKKKRVLVLSLDDAAVLKDTVDKLGENGAEVYIAEYTDYMKKKMVETLHFIEDFYGCKNVPDSLTRIKTTIDNALEPYNSVCYEGELLPK